MKSPDREESCFSSAGRPEFAAIPDAARPARDWPRTGRPAALSVSPWLLLVALHWVLSCGVLSSANAAIRTWSGGSLTSGNWSSSANWVGGVAPVAGDSLVFPPGAARLNNTNNFASGTAFGAVSISGTGYAIRGNLIALTGGISADYAAGTSVFSPDLRLDAAQTFSVALATGTLIVGGDVNLNGRGLTLSSAGANLMGGGISGTGDITKTGSGRVEFVGIVANTFVGVTRVNAGTLVLGKFFGSGLVSVPGGLVVGDGTGGAGADVVLLQSPDQIANASGVTINSSGLLDLNEWSDTIGALTLSSGRVETGIGTLTLGGNVTVLATGTATLNGRISLGSATRVFDTPSGGNVLVNARVSGTGGISKSGLGFLTLASSNNFSGVLTIQAGYVDVQDDDALGATSGGSQLQGGVLRLSGVVVEVEPLGASGGRLQAIGSSNAWTGPIQLTNTLSIEVPNAGQILNLAGIIGGPGGFTKMGPGTLLLSGPSANTFAGDVAVDAGLLLLDKGPTDGGLPGPGDLTVGDGAGGVLSDIVRELSSFQIDGSVGVTVNDSGLLDLNDFSDTIGPLEMVGGRITTGAGLITLSGDVTATSTVEQTARIYGRATWGAATRTFNIVSGPISPELRIIATVSGSGGLRKTGTGWLGLSYSNSYSGLTTVVEGRLAVEDDFALGTTAAGTVVESGATLVLAGARVGNEALTLGSDGPGTTVLSATLAIYSNSWAGPITLAVPVRIAVENDTSFINLSGPLSGAGGFTKTGAGTLILSGPTGNTHAGDTVVNEGMLELAKVAGTGVAVRNGRLTIGDGLGGASADRVRFQAINQLWSTVAVDITASGLLDLNGFTDNLGDLNFSGGRATSGSGGILYLVGTVTADDGSGTIEGRLDISGTRTFDTVDASGANLFVDAQVTGTGGITKIGPGQLYLSSANTYMGATVVNGGRLYADDGDSLGSTASGCTVNSGAALVLRFNSHVGVEPLALYGVGEANLGALASIYGSNSWGGPITLGSAVRMTTLQADDTLHLSGSIVGSSSDLTLEGSGTVIFSGADQNTYSGMTRVNSGTLVLNKSGANRAIAGPVTIGDGAGGAEADVVRLAMATQIANASDVTVNRSGLLDLNSNGEAIDALSGSGRVNLGSGFLNIGTVNGSSTFDGSIRGVGGDVSKLGDGTITFNGTNTYSGVTAVSGGSLFVNGVQPASTVSISPGATLGGSGTVGPITSTGGIVSPGTSPGLLNGGNLLLDAASSFVAELTGPTPGSLHDQLNIVGVVNLGAAALVVDVTGLAPAPGDLFTLVNNDGGEAVIGTFAGLANGATFSVGPRQFRIYYNGGSGNDVVLQSVGIPLTVVAATVQGGNGNGIIDPNECDGLALSLFNTGTNVVTGVEATLVSTTPGVSVTQARTGFPDIPASAGVAGAEAFQISTSPFLTCGTILDFVLTIETAGHGSFKLNFNLLSGSPGSAVTFNAADTPMAIADNASVTSIVQVAGIVAPVSRVTVSLYTTHANLADLDISLIAPDGTTVLLTSDNGDTSDSYGTGCSEAERTLFDDTAATGIASASPPFVGRFRPEGSLRNFMALSGAAVNGPWKLRVSDDAAGSTGALNCWSLFIAPATCPPGTGPCSLCGDTTLTGVLVPSEPDANRLVLNGVPGACGVAKPCPGSAGGMSEFQAYPFVSGSANACVTVVLESSCPSSNAVTSAAYLGAYNPLSICAGYLADAGAGAFAGTARSYSFNVPANTNFWIIVQMVTDDAPCGEYALTVSGADCRPALDIVPAPGNRVVLSWPTYAPGYDLQATGVLLSSPPNAFNSVTPAPVVKGSRYTVTNSASGAARYYRLLK